jgi:hypothetical protein
MASPQTERREFFRISDRLLVEFREVSYEESQLLESGMRQDDGLDVEPTAALPVRAPCAEDRLYQYLQAIDKKLDTVIEMLSRRDDCFQGAYLDVDISGAGMKCRPRTPFREGAYLEIRITLPSDPCRRVTALGRVVRTMPGETAHGEVLDTAIRFVAMRERTRTH